MKLPVRPSFPAGMTHVTQALVLVVATVATTLLVPATPAQAAVEKFVAMKVDHDYQIWFNVDHTNHRMRAYAHGWDNSLGLGPSVQVNHIRIQSYSRAIGDWVEVGGTKVADLDGWHYDDEAASNLLGCGIAPQRYRAVAELTHWGSRYIWSEDFVIANNSSC